MTIALIATGVVPAAATPVSTAEAVTSEVIQLELARGETRAIALTPLLEPGFGDEVFWQVRADAGFPESMFATLGPTGTLTITADTVGSFTIPVEFRTIESDWTSATLAIDVVTKRRPIFQARGDAPATPPQPSSLASSQACADILFVGARGSGQPTTQGEGYGAEIAAIRDGVVASLGSWLSMRQVWLEYTAAPVTDISSDPFGYLASINDGISKLTVVLQDSRVNCPDEQWVIGGYSQGSLVVRDTAYDVRSFGARLDQVILLADPGRMMGGANGDSDAGVPNWGTGDTIAAGSGVAAAGFVATLAGTEIIAASYRAVTVHLCDEYDSVCDKRSGSIPVDGDAIHGGYGLDVPRLQGWGTQFATAINARETTGVLEPVTPTIGGVAQVGATLSVTTGTWGPGAVDLAIQWFAGATALGGETGPSLVVPPGAYGLAITVTVSGTRGGYVPAARTSVPTGPVVALFADAPPEHPFNESIEWMRTAGISNGYLDEQGVRTYHPVEDVSRQAMAAFLYRLAGSPSFVPPATATFADVPIGSPFFAEIEWMKAAGITNGNVGPGGTLLFLPADSISRQAMAAFLYRLAGSPDVTPPATATFADVPVGAPFFAEIEWMNAEGITNGNVGPGDTLVYLPFDPVSRQAMAAFLYRYAH